MSATHYFITQYVQRSYICMYEYAHHLKMSCRETRTESDMFHFKVNTFIELNLNLHANNILC